MKARERRLTRGAADREHRARSGAGRIGDERPAPRETVDLFELLADELEAAVRETLSQRSPEPARLLAAKVDETDAAIVQSDSYDEDDGAPGLSIAFAVLSAWISGARAELDTDGVADTVLDWIAEQLGEPVAALARRAAAILDAPDAADRTVDEVADELGLDFIPAMLWLATGLVAEYGDSDTAWLRRHDLPPGED